MARGRPSIHKKITRLINKKLPSINQNGGRKDCPPSLLKPNEMIDMERKYIKDEFLKVANDLSDQLMKLAEADKTKSKGYLVVAFDSSVSEDSDEGNYVRAMLGTKPVMTDILKSLLSDPDVMPYAKRATQVIMIEKAGEMLENIMKKNREVDGCEYDLTVKEWNHSGEYRYNQENVVFNYGDDFIDADITIGWNETPTRHYEDTPPESETTKECTVYVNCVYDREGDNEKMSEAQRAKYESQIKEYVLENAEKE